MAIYVQDEGGGMRCLLLRAAVILSVAWGLAVQAAHLLNPRRMVGVFLAISLSLAGLSGYAGDTGDEPTVVVVIETTMGAIEMEVYRDRAPLSAESFLSYVDQGLFSQYGAFYRTVHPGNDNGSPVIAVIQGGITGASKALPPVPHESTKQTGILHKDATVSLARTKPGTGNGAAFFICIGDQPALDYGGTRNADKLGFAAFGKVIKGMDVVRSIQAEPSTGATTSPYVKGQILDQPVVFLKAYRKHAEGV